MIERGRGAGFLRKALQAVMIGDERRRQNLDGYSAIEARIVGAIDLAHSSCAEGRQNFIGTETTSSGNGHTGCMILPQFAKPARNRSRVIQTDGLPAKSEERNAGFWRRGAESNRR